MVSPSKMIGFENKSMQELNSNCAESIIGEKILLWNNRAHAAGIRKERDGEAILSFGRQLHR
jgi:hypothetical protein